MSPGPLPIITIRHVFSFDPRAVASIFESQRERIGLLVLLPIPLTTVLLQPIPDLRIATLPGILRADLNIMWRQTTILSQMRYISALEYTINFREYRICQPREHESAFMMWFTAMKVFQMPTMRTDITSRRLQVLSASRLCLLCLDQSGQRLAVYNRFTHSMVYILGQDITLRSSLPLELMLRIVFTPSPTL